MGSSAEAKAVSTVRPVPSSHASMTRWRRFSFAGALTSRQKSGNSSTRSRAISAVRAPMSKRSARSTLRCGTSGANRSVSRSMRAFRDRVIAYATGGYYGADFRDGARALADLEKETAAYAAGGFGILKMKVGLLPVEADAERVAVVRRAVGNNVKLLADANHAYNAATAIRMGRELEKHGVLWFEEPVIPEDRLGYRKVREALAIPIAGGECEYTRYGFRDLFVGQCVDIAQPDLCVCGGFSEWLKIQALASSFGVMTIPHVWGSGVALAAALHALAAIPPSPHTANPVALQNEPVVEYAARRTATRKVRVCVGSGRALGSAGTRAGRQSQ